MHAAWSSAASTVSIAWALIIANLRALAEFGIEDVDGQGLGVAVGIIDSVATILASILIVRPALRLFGRHQQRGHLLVELLRASRRLGDGHRRNPAAAPRHAFDAPELTFVGEGVAEIEICRQDAGCEVAH
jgi:hypothetical protein